MGNLRAGGLAATAARPPARAAAAASRAAQRLDRGRGHRVASRHAAAGALERARRAGVPTTVLADPSDAAQLLASLGDAGLVVLAGYLKHVPAPVVARFRLRMINIHPALLPAFGGPGMYGRRVHRRGLARGAAR